MKKTAFYCLTLLGILLFLFGLFLTASELKSVLNYSSLQEKSPNHIIVTKYGTTVNNYLSIVWKSFSIWGLITLIGWIVIFYSDKLLNIKRWVNDDYAPIMVIAILALPVYYFFSTI